MNAEATPSVAEEDPGKFSENILYFSRTLRHAGMRIGPSSVIDAIQAVKAAGIGHRSDFYWTLHAVLVSRHEDHAVFDEAFRLFWRSRDLIEKMIAMFSPLANPKGEPEPPKPAQSRVAEALFQGNENQKEIDRPQVEVDSVFSVSQKEVLRTKDFSQMNAAEIALAKREISKLELPVNLVRTRRYQPWQSAEKIDPRATLRQSMRTGGDLILPKFRKPREVHPPLVVLADISGSMSQYSRIFLHFLHALTENRRRVHTFLFGTRLTNVTRALKMKDPDEALAETSALVEDWEGGTRIAETLYQFNLHWSRRVLGQGAIVLLITDGLERDGEEGLSHDLAKQMDRLHKSCRRLIWLNPLLRFDGFEARASGVRTMLPHVDEFRAVHSLDAIAALCAALSSGSSAKSDPRLWM